MYVLLDLVQQDDKSPTDVGIRGAGGGNPGVVALS